MLGICGFWREDIVINMGQRVSMTKYHGGEIATLLGPRMDKEWHNPTWMHIGAKHLKASPTGGQNDRPAVGTKFITRPI